jgi:hypothetical protein
VRRFRGNPQTFFTFTRRKKILPEKLQSEAGKIVTLKSPIPMLRHVRRATPKPL